MSPTPEELLQEAARLHSVSDFKKGMKTAEKARKKFKKDQVSVLKSGKTTTCGYCGTTAG